MQILFSRPFSPSAQHGANSSGRGLIKYWIASRTALLASVMTQTPRTVAVPDGLEPNYVPEVGVVSHFDSGGGPLFTNSVVTGNTLS